MNKAAIEEMFGSMKEFSDTALTVARSLDHLSPEAMVSLMVSELHSPEPNEAVHLWTNFMMKFIFTFRQMTDHQSGALEPYYDMFRNLILNLDPTNQDDISIQLAAYNVLSVVVADHVTDSIGHLMNKNGDKLTFVEAVQRIQSGWLL